MSCSNGTHASRHFSSFPLRLRQPQPRSRTSKEERRPRAGWPPQLARPPRLVRRPPPMQRLHRMWRPHPIRHLPRRISPPRGPRPTSPRHGSLRGRPAVHLRRWRGTRRRRELWLQRSSPKPRAATSAVAVERNSPNRTNPARATIRGASPGRAVQQRWALLRALLQRHSPLTSDATRPSNKMRPSPIS